MVNYEKRSVNHTEHREPYAARRYSNAQPKKTRRRVIALLCAAVIIFAAVIYLGHEQTPVSDRPFSTEISADGFTRPNEKNNLDLVVWAKQARDGGWGYVWGTYGLIMGKKLYKQKLEQYPQSVGDYAEFISENWVGRRTADCVGLIKGYEWLDADTLDINYCSNGFSDIGADAMFESAEQKGEIDSIPETAGLAVWKEGHIGIYIGGGKVIQAAGTLEGVIETKLRDTEWTHWLKIPSLAYYDE